MFKLTFQAPLLAFVMIGTLWAATDSFVGDWKLNTSKSKIIDVMKVQSLDAQKYSFDFGGGAEKIAVDGTDQSGVYGTMLSVTVEGPDTWKVVRKKDGRMLLTATWKLSKDGNTLTDSYTEFRPNGSPSTTSYQYQRTSGGSGFAGTWESTMPADSAYVLQIRPYEENGLSFTRSSDKVAQNVKFDGKDYPIVGNAIQGLTWSVRRVDERTLEITDKLEGKIMRTEHLELSPDLKTLTRTIRPIGQREPNIFVFERQ